MFHKKKYKSSSSWAKHRNESKFTSIFSRKKCYLCLCREVLGFLVFAGKIFSAFSFFHSFLLWADIGWALVLHQDSSTMRTQTKSERGPTGTAYSAAAFFFQKRSNKPFLEEKSIYIVDIWFELVCIIVCGKIVYNSVFKLPHKNI